MTPLVVIVLGLAALPAVELDWQAPKSCPSSDEVAKQMAAALEGMRPAGVRAVVEARDDRWVLRVEIEIDGVAAERELEDTSCAALAEALVVIVALAAGEEPAVRAPVTPAAPAELEVPSSVPVESWRLGLSLGMGADVGSLPAVAGLVVLAAHLWRAGWGVELGARGYEPRRRERSGGAGAEALLLGGVLRGCAGWTVAETWRLDGCVGAEAGWLRAEAFGISDPETASDLWVAAVAMPRLRWLLSESWWVALSAEVAVPLRRPRFVVANVGELYRAEPVVGRVWASVGVGAF